MRSNLTELKTVLNDGEDNDVDSKQESFGAKGTIQEIRNQFAFRLHAKAFGITVAINIKLSSKESRDLESITSNDQFVFRQQQGTDNCQAKKNIQR